MCGNCAGSASPRVTVDPSALVVGRQRAKALEPDDIPGNEFRLDRFDQIPDSVFDGTVALTGQRGRSIGARH